jgi:hypothetical protein
VAAQLITAELSGRRKIHLVVARSTKREERLGS